MDMQGFVNEVIFTPTVPHPPKTRQGDLVLGSVELSSSDFFSLNQFVKEMGDL